jgi:hypothetical protein
MDPWEFPCVFCGASVADPSMAGPAETCPGCGVRYEYDEGVRPVLTPEMVRVVANRAGLVAELERIAAAWDDTSGGNADESFVFNLGTDFRERIGALIAKVGQGR